MKIIKAAVGNNIEAYVEDRFTDGFNIISSNENNKGKTILIQSILYALGNAPIFPSTFSYKDYYHYVEIDVDGVTYNICRKKDTFHISFSHKNYLTQGVSEFKRFFNKNGINFPLIIKDGNSKMVDPELLYQIFFIGQDKKNTDSIINKGYYKNDDFINMIYSLAGYEPIQQINVDLERNKELLREFINKKKELVKLAKVIKTKTDSANTLYKYADREQLKKTLDDVKQIQNEIVVLKSRRSRLNSKIVDFEETLAQLNNLRKKEQTGYFKCIDCGSRNIVYVNKNDESEFEISNSELREKFYDSINDRLLSCREESDKLTFGINQKQDKIQNLLKETDKETLTSLIFLASETDNINYDSELIKIDDQIKELKSTIENRSDSKTENNEKNAELINQILKYMNDFLHKVDQLANVDYDSIFTKRDATYSGVEGPVFYLSKLYAFYKVLNHKFPIIVDYFRDGEMSSDKEKRVIEIFKDVSNQILFTATLKNEEENKYKNIDFVNNIDFSINDERKLLNEKSVNKFIELIKIFEFRIAE